jgi:hypothetical protein
MWGLVLPETGLCGLKTGFLRSRPIFEVSPIKTKTGVRYNSKALSTISVYFSGKVFGGGKTGFNKRKFVSVLSMFELYGIPNLAHNAES